LISFVAGWSWPRAPGTGLGAARPALDQAQRERTTVNSPRSDLGPAPSSTARDGSEQEETVLAESSWLRVVQALAALSARAEATGEPGSALPVLPEVVRGRLERRGYRVEQRPVIASVEIGDGRQVTLPVEELKLRYVGGQTY
jgi:hypothetical protein